jgi:hypothetical protein
MTISWLTKQLFNIFIVFERQLYPPGVDYLPSITIATAEFYIIVFYMFILTADTDRVIPFITQVTLYLKIDKINDKQNCSMWENADEVLNICNISTQKLPNLKQCIEKKIKIYIYIYTSEN